MESKNNWKAWLYLAPTIILMLIFTIYPLINTIIISFLKHYDYTQNTFAGTSFTFDNYLLIFGKTGQYYIDGTFSYTTTFMRYALINTLIIVFVTVPASIFLALLIAVGLNSIKWFRRIFQTIFFMPYVTNAIAIGMVFAVMFQKDFGLINMIFGTHKNWIDFGASRWSAMFVLCVYIIWHALPYKILIFLSGLQGIDKQYYQAAKIDSTPKVKVFTRITIPLLSPQIAYVFITSFIGAFKEYSSVVALLNNPGPNGKLDNSLLTIVYYIYNMMDKPASMSLAAAAAVVLLLIVLFFTFIQLYVSNKKVHY